MHEDPHHPCLLLLPVLQAAAMLEAARCAGQVEVLRTELAAQQEARKAAQAAQVGWAGGWDAGEVALN